MRAPLLVLDQCLVPTASNRERMERIEALWSSKCDGLIFINLVDFDMLYGHRRDVLGYGRTLEEFDRWLGRFLPAVEPPDLVVVTADHGNDPMHHGTDHTREQVPLFVRRKRNRRPWNAKDIRGYRREPGAILRVTEYVADRFVFLLDHD